MTSRPPACSRPGFGRALALLALGVAWLAGAGSSRAEDGLRAIDLGAGASVHQVWSPCGVTRCAIWVPLGFRFDAQPELALASTFARVPRTGRIVAARGTAQPWASPLGASTAYGRDYVLYTDDLGASWQTARWRWWTAPRAIAFDAGSTFGVAAGDGGYVWNTEDGGATWVDRRDASGQTFEAAWVIGRACVLRDAAGVVWVSRDGGFVLERLTGDPSARIEQAEGAIVVRAGRETLRVTREGPSS